MSEKNQLLRDLIGIETIEKVKRLLKFSEEAPAPVAPLVPPQDVVFAEAKLKDGSVVKTEGAIAEGSNLILVTPDGEVPAPDGDHELEDGTIISVAGGVITAIKAVDVAIEEAMNKIAEVETKVADIVKTNAALKSQLEQTQKFNKELFALVEKILNSPSGEPIETPATVNAFTSLKEDLAGFRKSLKN